MNTEIASTIIAQLGRSVQRLQIMIGAKGFDPFVNGVAFKWSARAKNGANKIQIILSEKDDYGIAFLRVSRGDVHQVKFIEGVYAEDLKRIFETETGLYLSI